LPLLLFRTVPSTEQKLNRRCRAGTQQRESMPGLPAWERNKLRRQCNPCHTAVQIMALWAPQTPCCRECKVERRQVVQQHSVCTFRCSFRQRLEHGTARHGGCGSSTVWRLEFGLTGRRRRRQLCANRPCGLRIDGTRLRADRRHTAPCGSTARGSVRIDRTARVRIDGGSGGSSMDQMTMAR